MFKHFVLLVLILPAFGNEEETTLLQTHETTKLEVSTNSKDDQNQHADGNQTRWRPTPAPFVGCTGGWPGSGWRYEQKSMPSSGGWSYAQSAVCDYEGCKGDNNCMGVAWVKGRKDCYRIKQGSTISSKSDWEVCIKDDTTTPLEEMYKTYSPTCKPVCDRFNHHGDRGRGTCSREACAGWDEGGCKCLSKAEYKERFEKKESTLMAYACDNTLATPGYCCQNGVTEYPCYLGIKKNWG